MILDTRASPHPLDRHQRRLMAACFQSAAETVKTSSA
jgi:hypothetical protein